MAGSNNTVYDVKVIENRAKDLLLTKVNVKNMMDIDTSLEEEAGMTKTVNLYTYTGKAEELGVGEGNSVTGSIDYVGKDYTVKTTQEHFAYFDEDAMKAPEMVDKMIDRATQVLVNKMTEDFTAAITSEDITNVINLEGNLSYDSIVDAISKVNIEDESELFIVIPNSWKADLRKDPDYTAARMGEIIYSGQIAAIAGIPVIASKALDEAETAVVMTKEAVRLFMKNDVNVEYERDANIRKNKYYLRATYLVALFDTAKICKITKADDSE